MTKIMTVKEVVNDILQDSVESKNIFISIIPTLGDKKSKLPDFCYISGNKTEITYDPYSVMRTLADAPVTSVFVTHEHSLQNSREEEQVWHIQVLDILQRITFR